MNRRNTFLILCLMAGTFSLRAQIPSPAEFLGYELGTKFTRHHQVVDYYQAVDEASDQVQLIEYGRTYEDRPLLLAFVSSSDNLQNLDGIRLDNLRRAQMEDGAPGTDKGIVWLSYNVHGNESVSTEASMATIHTILTEKQEWLDDMIVIIDPCINPDGRERYVNHYWQYGNRPYNPDPNSLEHNEPWPRGRANHYLFDLNRDWAWQSQVESQARLKVYNQWLPHVHVDFHEQGVNSPYYFAPAAQPYHELITDWQRQFQVDIGRNHARYFDENDWFYFTKQYFDLLYPSYGDTYPMYNGAIGMTYEQGGSGRAGLGVLKEEGDTLTLGDRIAHHYTTGLSTVEEAYKQREKMLTEFQGYYEKGISSPPGKYKTFVIKGDQPEKIAAIQQWLDKLGVQYGGAEGSRNLRGYDYHTKTQRSFTLQEGDLVVSSYQPKSVLTHVLFEPKTFLVDSLTYDITAWAVPYAYGVQGYALTDRVNPTEATTTAFEQQSAEGDVYAYAFGWKGVSDAAFLGFLMKEGVKPRFSTRPITVGGLTLDRGSVVVSERDNPHIAGFADKMVSWANDWQQEIHPIQSGFVDQGPDIGSNDIHFLKAPKVGLLSGESTSSLSFGATWYHFEQELKYPVTVLDTRYFGSVDLSQYDVLVMPDGWYSDLRDNDMEDISAWVRAGGKLIAIKGALRKFRDSDFSGLSEYADDDEKASFEKADKERKKKRRKMQYAQRSREGIKGEVPGAIFKVTLDNSHPLAYGYGNHYYTLKTGSARYGLLDGAWNVGYIESANDHMGGFAGQYVKEQSPNSLVLGVERSGRGVMVFLVDDPLFRAFWQNGKLLFDNALFFVGQ